MPGRLRGVQKKGNLELFWNDEFTGSSLDTTKWCTQSDSYSDAGRGNKPDHKLEYNLDAQVTVASSILTITALKSTFTAPSAIVYDWRSGLITTGHGFGVTPSNGVSLLPGYYMEVRMQVPSTQGMWPAIWMWAEEVDVMEYHTDNATYLELSNRLGVTSLLYYDTGSAVSGMFHTYGVYLGSSSVAWYYDGKCVFTDSVGFSSSGASPIINLSVSDGTFHPAPGVGDTTATMQVDYVRVYAPAS